jgi:hypothetical protein
MNTTEPLTRQPPPAPTDPPGDAPLRATQAPAYDGIADELVPLDVVVAGPPVSFVAAPLLLLALMLSAPFAVMVVLVAVWLLAVVLLATLAGILATPFLVVRRLHRGYRTSRATARPRPAIARIDSRRAVA